MRRDVEHLLAVLLDAAGDHVLDLARPGSRRARSPRCSSGRAARSGGCPCSSPSPCGRARSACAPPRRSRPRDLLRHSLLLSLVRLPRKRGRRRSDETVTYCTQSSRESNGIQPTRGVRERLGIAGSGVIACGLAVAAADARRRAALGSLGRTRRSAPAARSRRRCANSRAVDAERVRIVDRPRRPGRRHVPGRGGLEHHGSKAAVLADLGELARHAGAGAVLATTTSSLSIAELAQASGHPERFVGLTSFNPVPRMELSSWPSRPQATAETARPGAHALRGARQDAGRGARHTRLRRQPAAVPVPVQRRRADIRDRHGARGCRQCMTLGAGMPMGPIALLDFVGLDVSQAIGEAIGARSPPGCRARRRRLARTQVRRRLLQLRITSFRGLDGCSGPRAIFTSRRTS